VDHETVDHETGARSVNVNEPEKNWKIRADGPNGGGGAYEAYGHRVRQQVCTRSLPREEREAPDPTALSYTRNG